MTIDSRTNYTWIISVQEGFQVQLTVFELVTLYSGELTICDGMFQSSRHIGSFNWPMIVGLKSWTVFGTGRNLWVNMNACYPGQQFKLRASFKATKFNKSKLFSECTFLDSFAVSSKVKPDISET